MRQRVVGDDDVPGAAFERGRHLLTRLDALEGGLVPRPLQLAGDQHHLVLDVLHDEDADRLLAHGRPRLGGPVIATRAGQARWRRVDCGRPPEGGGSLTSSQYNPSRRTAAANWPKST